MSSVRTWIVAAVAASLALATPAEAPASVRRDPLRSIDAPILRAMRRYGVKGGVVAVTRRGRLVALRAYGRTGMDPRVRTDPNARFRIASLSKPITAVAIHLLVAQGRLSLDQPVLDVLAIEPPPDATLDPRWRRVTVRRLLEHSGGWDRMETRFDPTFESRTIAKSLGVALPPTLEDIVRYMLGQPLDFEPGTRYAYSNFGYSLLGLVIERTTGEPYEAWVRTHVLAPMGIRRMEIGHELVRDRPADETLYFDDPDEGLAPNLFSEAHELVPPSDGGFAMAPMAAHGGWIASAADYARFLVHVDGLPSPPDLLPSAELEAMLAPPSHRDFDPREGWYGHGFDVIPQANGERIWSHTGAKPGTTTIAVRDPHGFSYVALMNGRPLEGDFSEDLDRAIGAGLDAVPKWPDVDLFETVP